MQNQVFLLVFTLGGILPALNFISIGSPCLHTANSNYDLFWTDKYQFLVSVVLWTILVPTFCMMMSIFYKDKSRLAWYPILIANLIFGVVMFFLALILIYSTIMHGESYELRYLYIFSIGWYVFGRILTIIYKVCFDKIDVHKKNGSVDKEGEAEESKIGKE
jgi:hypothetical protein